MPYQNPYLGHLTPEQVMSSKYMSNSNPLLDLLVAHYMQTRTPERKREVVTERSPPKKNKMRETPGPIKAKKAKEYASKRDEMTRKIP